MAIINHAELYFSKYSSFCSYLERKGKQKSLVKIRLITLFSIHQRDLHEGDEHQRTKDDGKDTPWGLTRKVEKWIVLLSTYPNDPFFPLLYSLFPYKEIDIFLI